MKEKKRRFDYVLFDLDGTLTDSAPGIANALQLALREQGVVIEDARELYQYAGPPLDEIFHAVAPHFTEEDIRKATGVYRAYYNQQGWKENKLFDGTVQMLTKLQKAGMLLATASSKPEEFVQRICTHFQIDSFLHHMTGANVKYGRYKKAEVVEDSLAVFPEETTGRTVLVGDRVYDVKGGHEMGLPVIGLTFGYGGRKELTDAGCDYIFDTYQELEGFLLGE